MDLQYIPRAEDLVTIAPGRHLVDTHATLWQRAPSGWVDPTFRHRTSLALLNMRGPVYLLPEDFTGELTLDDLSDAEPGDYLVDCMGSRWGKTTAGRWLLAEQDDPRGLVKSSEDLLAVYSPLLPAPRPGDTYVRPVPAMEAAARQEEARPVGFWRRLWNGLVWG